MKRKLVATLERVDAADAALGEAARICRAVLDGYDPSDDFEAMQVVEEAARELARQLDAAKAASVPHSDAHREPPGTSGNVVAAGDLLALCRHTVDAHMAHAGLVQAAQDALFVRPGHDPEGRGPQLWADAAEKLGARLAQVEDPNAPFVQAGAARRIDVAALRGMLAQLRYFPAETVLVRTLEEHRKALQVVLDGTEDAEAAAAAAAAAASGSGAQDGESNGGGGGGGGGGVAGSSADDADGAGGAAAGSDAAVGSGAAATATTAAPAAAAAGPTTFERLDVALDGMSTALELEAAMDAGMQHEPRHRGFEGSKPLLDDVTQSVVEVLDESVPKWMHEEAEWATATVWSAIQSGKALPAEEPLPDWHMYVLNERFDHAETTRRPACWSTCWGSTWRRWRWWADPPALSDVEKKRRAQMVAAGEGIPPPSAPVCGDIFLRVSKVDESKRGRRVGTVDHIQVGHVVIALFGRDLEELHIRDEFEKLCASLPAVPPAGRSTDQLADSGPVRARVRSNSDGTVNTTNVNSLDFQAALTHSRAYTHARTHTTMVHTYLLTYALHTVSPDVLVV